MINDLWIEHFNAPYPFSVSDWAVGFASPYVPAAQSHLAPAAAVALPVRAGGPSGSEALRQRESVSPGET